MLNPFFYVFDGFRYGFKWLGDNAWEVFAFSMATVAWYTPTLIELMAQTGPRGIDGELWTEWNIWVSLGSAIFLAVNYFFWIKDRKRYGEYKLSHFVITSMLFGAIMYSGFVFAIEILLLT